MKCSLRVSVQIDGGAGPESCTGFCFNLSLYNEDKACLTAAAALSVIQTSGSDVQELAPSSSVHMNWPLLIQTLTL